MSDDADRGESERRLPVVHPRAAGANTSAETATDTAPRVAGVLLAAGTSSRFGDTNKLLAPLDGEPLVRHAARTLVDAGLDPLVAVVGHQSEAVAAALEGLGFETIENPHYDTGQATSVRRGIESLTAASVSTVDAVVFALGDMPAVAPASVRALVDVYRTGEWTALAAAVEGERGNPVLFDRRHFEALTAVSGDTGGRHVLRTAERSALVETGDAGVRRDVDTRADLERLD